MSKKKRIHMNMHIYYEKCIFIACQKASACLLSSPRKIIPPQLNYGFFLISQNTFTAFSLVSNTSAYALMLLTLAIK